MKLGWEFIFFLYVLEQAMDNSDGNRYRDQCMAKPYQLTFQLRLVAYIVPDYTSSMRKTALCKQLAQGYYKKQKILIGVGIDNACCQ